MGKKELAICAGCIIGTYLVFGILQEKLFKSEYQGQGLAPERFKFPTAVGLLQFLIGLLTSYFLVAKEKTKMSLKEEIPLGFLNSVSLLSSNTALLYVSYPLQALTKSCKVMSVVLASLLNPWSKSKSKDKLGLGLVFTVGIFIFNFFDSKKGDKTNQVFGIALLLLSLTFDGLLPEYQTYVKSEYSPSSNLLYYYTSKWSLVTCFAVSVLKGELVPMLQFMFSREGIKLDLFLFSMAGVIGQYFIFYTIKNFESYVLPMITSSRKALTVLFSILVYSHPISAIQGLGILIVFSVVVYEFVLGKDKPHSDSKKHEEEAKPLVS